MNRKDRRSQQKTGVAPSANHLAQWFGQAVRLHQSGKLKEAAAFYRKILAASPAQPEAHHNLGLALKGLGQLDDGILSIRQALALNPFYSEAHNSLGNALTDAGDLDAAASAFRRAIEIAPDYAIAHNNLGAVLRDLGQAGKALECFDAALMLAPHYAEAHNNKGATLHDLGRHEAALQCFGRALDLEAAHFRALANRAGTSVALGRYDQALADGRRAIELAPTFATAHNTVGNALKAMGRLEDAVQSYRAAVTHAPHLPELHDNLGNALSELGQSLAAEAACRQALTLRPDFAKAHNNLGTALRDQGRREDSLRCFQRALALDPQMAAAHANLGMALLYDGDYRQGWAEFEWRWQTNKLQDKPASFPRWTGQELRGKTLLLYAEQGLGDVLHFVRYAPLLAQQGARILLEVQPALVRLLAQTPGVAQVIALSEPLLDASRPAFDYCLPLMSAPLRLGTTLETIPSAMPYVHALPEWRAPWLDALEKLPGLKVGVVWAGDPRPHDANANAADRRRSIPLAQWTPILSAPGVSFISLQMGGGRAQIADIAPESRPFDGMDRVRDFADTAGLIDLLDLVISVDTSVAHLAGAMGKPVWILSRYDGCWRWLKSGTASPWYPSATLFRQNQPGDWSPVMAQVAQALGHKGALNAASP